ncbi:MAG: hypothetical protein ACRDD1_06475, partial [Planctomycetia bacterium]
MLFFLPWIPDKNPKKNNRPLKPGDFALLAVIAGVVSTYVGFALILNRTRFHAAKDKLTVDVVPLPWIGFYEFNADDVSQLYVHEGSHLVDSTVFDKEFWGAKSLLLGRKSVAHFNVRLVRRRDGREVTLVAHLPDREQAEQIERLVELYMEIEDRRQYG